MVNGNTWYFIASRPSELVEVAMALLRAALLVLLAVAVQAGVVSRPRGRSAADALRRVCALRGGEHTYAMLKPDIAGNEATVSSVKEMIGKAGLTIEREECAKLSRRDCEAFYAEHKGRPFFPGLVKFMSSGPVVKLELSGPNAIKRWRELIGPTNSITAREQAPKSVRALYGLDNQRNAAHGSDSPESASRELGMMFGS